MQFPIGSNPSRWKGDRNPVEQVRWSDAVRFCNKRSELEGLHPCYDLQTWKCNFRSDRTHPAGRETGTRWNRCVGRTRSDSATNALSWRDSTPVTTCKPGNAISDRIEPIPLEGRPEPGGTGALVGRGPILQQTL